MNLCVGHLLPFCPQTFDACPQNKEQDEHQDGPDTGDNIHHHLKHCKTEHMPTEVLPLDINTVTVTFSSIYSVSAPQTNGPIVQWCFGPV